MTEKITDLSAAYADITGRHIGIRADVAVKFRHKALAKTHNFHIGFAVRVKIASALCTAHRQTCKAVLEGLFKAKEFYYRFVYGGMEAQSAFIGTDCGVELCTIAAVYLNLAGIVNPRNAELYKALRFGNALQNGVLFNFGVLFNNRFQRSENLAYSLKEFLLVRISFFKCFINLFKIFAFE